MWDERVMRYHASRARRPYDMNKQKAFPAAGEAPGCTISHVTPKYDPAIITDVLPLLSVANVRELLRAAMPLPQLTTQQAIDLVVEHLVNRTRSRRSRLRKLAPAQPTVPG